MRLVIDDKIPFLRGVPERLGFEAVYLPGAGITAADVRHADALMVRTRTRCDAGLLEGSSVKFIVTATIGFDHIDTAYLCRAGIAWTNCPGCNAASVGQYVASALLVLQEEKMLSVSSATVGIVGVGHVGREVERAVRALGCRVLRNDPPRAGAEGGEGFVGLDTIAREADVVSFHVPLTREGPHATFHMAGSAFFSGLRKRPVLINAARGGVVCEEALLKALRDGTVSQAVVDTWENEPHISSALLEQALIATPHIAGYSADGKANATRMALTAVCRHFGVEPRFNISPPALPASFVPAANLQERALQLYDPRCDSRRLKEHPEQFEQLRGNYPLRRECVS